MTWTAESDDSRNIELAIKVPSAIFGVSTAQGMAVNEERLGFVQARAQRSGHAHIGHPDPAMHLAAGNSYFVEFEIVNPILRRFAAAKGDVGEIVEFLQQYVTLIRYQSRRDVNALACVEAFQRV